MEYSKLDEPFLKIVLWKAKGLLVLKFMNFAIPETIFKAQSSPIFLKISFKFLAVNKFKKAQFFFCVALALKT